MRKSGFTLIELLIVVAIIAILAAIAVPNFLEAQVRSKVSRVMSDQRSISVALEAYAVDNRRVPVDAQEYTNALKGPDPNFTDWTSFSWLTTPVAFMTSVPGDPFIAKGAKKGDGSVLNKTIFQYRSYLNVELWEKNKAGSAIPPCFARGYIWSLVSFGPSRDGGGPNKIANGTLAAMLTGKQGIGCYDPSNGTTSYGWIYRTNKGVGSGADYVGVY